MALCISSKRYSVAGTCDLEASGLDRHLSYWGQSRPLLMSSTHHLQGQVPTQILR